MNPPKILRILVIDDIVAGNELFMEHMRNLLSYLAYSAGNGKLDYVDVVFTDDPNKGLHLWITETFDLTLVDSDFSEKVDSKTKHEEREFPEKLEKESFLMHTKFQGLMLFHLLKKLMGAKDLRPEEKENFHYRNEMNHMFLWSALKKHELKDYLLGLEFHDYKPRTKHHYDLDKVLIHKKDPNSLEKLKNVLGECIKPIIETEDRKFSFHQAAERAITFARMKLIDFDKNNKAQRLPFPSEYYLDGFLICDPNNKFPYLNQLYPDRESKEKCLRITRRLPDIDFEETRFLPLSQIKKHKLYDLVSYITGEETKINFKYPKFTDQIHLEKGQVLFPKDYSYTTDQNKKGIKFLGYKFKNPYFAAATPLTGITAIGEKRAKDFFLKKIRALLKGPFSAVILKTIYLDDLNQWDSLCWPSLHVQSHMRTRCLRPLKSPVSLWNTGKTAFETFPPKILNELLIEIIKDRELADLAGENFHRIIISLGSKFRKGSVRQRFPSEVKDEMYGLWNKLFREIFAKLPVNSFPIVEINVRHYLRENLEYYTGGDEYLNPKGIQEAVERKGSEAMESDSFLEFKLWLESLQNVAVGYKKKLIFKFPYRTDLLRYIFYAHELRSVAKKRDKEYGIRSISFINTIKTPVQSSKLSISNPLGWGDATNKIGKYQMSGKNLSTFRDQILIAVLRSLPYKWDLEIIVGGGIIDISDKEFCLGGAQERIKKINKSKKLNKNCVKALQIGTLAIIDLDLSKPTINFK